MCLIFHANIQLRQNNIHITNKSNKKHHWDRTYLLLSFKSQMYTSWRWPFYLRTLIRKDSTLPLTSLYLSLVSKRENKMFLIGLLFLQIADQALATTPIGISLNNKRIISHPYSRPPLFHYDVPLLHVCSSKTIPEPKWAKKTISVTWHGVGGVSADCNQMINTIK